MVRFCLFKITHVDQIAVCVWAWKRLCYSQFVLIFIIAAVAMEIYLLLVLLMTTSTIVFSDDVCIQNKCYTLRTETSNQLSASRICASMGRRSGNLASIADKWEQDVLYQALSAHTNKIFWIGATFQYLPTWHWLNGDEYTTGSKCVFFVTSPIN